MNSQFSLVVLAAGMGSRYGGLKQIDEFGPTGQSLLEYAVYDALRAGFNHIVLVIRKEFEQAFREKFEAMLQAVPAYDFVYQVVDEGREKPRGTLDATLCARSVVSGPFAVVNADDRYGTQSYQLLADSLASIEPGQSYLVGYTLKNTLSEHGTVNRGVCKTNADAMLVDVVERYAIGTQGDTIQDRDANVFTGEETVSMNFWGFHPAYFEQSEAILEQFKDLHTHSSTAEMVIPDAVDACIQSKAITCQVLNSPDPRQGVTNAEDKSRVSAAFDKMHSEGVYPNDLWNSAQ